jgi:hypothetical protein
MSNYADTGSFARYRRPAKSNLKLSDFKSNKAYSFHHEERNPATTYNAKRNSVHFSNRKSDGYHENRGSMHQKTKSVGRIDTRNSIQNNTYDASYDNAYNDDENARKTVQQDPSSKQLFIRNPAFDRHAEPKNKVINNTDTYDDINENILPALNTARNIESLKISQSNNNLRRGSNSRLYDSFDNNTSNIGMRGSSLGKNNDYMRSNQPAVSASLSQLPMSQAQGLVSRQDVERQS